MQYVEQHTFSLLLRDNSAFLKMVEERKLRRQHGTPLIHASKKGYKNGMTLLNILDQVKIAA